MPDEIVCSTNGTSILSEASLEYRSYEYGSSLLTAETVNMAHQKKLKLALMIYDRNLSSQV